jgi:hypothetical protein
VKDFILRSFLLNDPASSAFIAVVFALAFDSHHVLGLFLGMVFTLVLRYK